MTTAIRVLATLLLPTAGSARVFGDGAVEEAEQVRASVSLTGQFAVGAGTATSCDRTSSELPKPSVPTRRRSHQKRVRRQLELPA